MLHNFIILVSVYFPALYQGALPVRIRAVLPLGYAAKESRGPQKQALEMVVKNFKTEGETADAIEIRSFQAIMLMSFFAPFTYHAEALTMTRTKRIESIYRLASSLAVVCFLSFWICSAAMAGTTPIHVEMEQGGDIETGNTSQWDGSYENVYGAIFWDGSHWITNDTARHLYFTDLRTGLRLKVHNNVDISSDPTQLGENTSITGYKIVKSIYSYSIDRSSPIPMGPNAYTYQALQYAIQQPDGTNVLLRSRGSGNGISQSLFDVYIENGNGSTTAMRGDPVWYDYENKSAAEAANETDKSTGVSGCLCTYSTTSTERNNYWMDINGGSDQGGVTYHLIVGTLDASTVPLSNLGKPFIIEFRIGYTDSEGQIQDLIFNPAILNESATTINDSFSDKAFSAQHWKVVSGKWAVSKKGEFSCNQKKKCLATISNSAVPGVTSVQARIKLLSKKASKFNASLIFAYQGAKTYRYVTISPTKITLGQQGNIGEDKKGVKAKVKAKIKKNKWQTLKVDLLSDGTAQVSLNGTLVASAVFKTASSGAVGLASAKSASVFDDFVATSKVGS